MKQENSMATKHCFMCGEFGHYKTMCPNPLNQVRFGCINCKSKAHDIEDCPIRNNIIEKLTN